MASEDGGFVLRERNYDDSNFNTLLTHRLSDGRTPQDGGIAVCVSSSS